MCLINRFKDEAGQGLVEYGLILTLVSIVAVGALGNVGYMVSDTFSLVSNPEISALINDGYIPVSTAKELSQLNNNEVLEFGKGTRWEGLYESGSDKKFVQVGNIDLSDYSNWEPIGGLDDEFVGVYDGGGFSITNLTIHRPGEKFQGLFGIISDSEIINVSVRKGNVEGEKMVGLLSGEARGSMIANVSVDGEVVGNGFDGWSDTGGVVGTLDRSTVDRAVSAVNVKGEGSVGGLVGIMRKSTITNSYADSDVEGTVRVGGLVGFASTSKNAGPIGSLIENSYSSSKVSGKGIGAILGASYESFVIGSYWDEEVTGLNDSAGGEGKSTEEMQQQSTYTGWDFDHVWKIKDGQYPILR